MSTIVYQGFVEPQPTETTTLRLKLAAPKPIEFEDAITKQILKNTTNQMTEKSYSGGWDFLQSLLDSTRKKPLDGETFSPSLRLSQKSLELCTENLGSETGSDDASDTDILSFSSMDAKYAKSTTTTTTRRAQGHVSSTKKANTRSFPPPLTTISGSNSIQVRPYREGGRLIIEAVEAPCNRTCFEAERSNGRLQLKFLKNCEFFYDQKMRSSSEDNQDDNIGESESKDHDTNKTEVVFEENNFGKNQADNNIVQVKDGGNGNLKKDVDGNRKDVEVEVGREKFQRHNRRCKESGHGNNNKGLCFREAFWVAT